MITLKQIKEVLDNNDPAFIEGLAQKSKETTLHHFGRTISLYAPLYLASYCDNICTYCGFSRNLKMERKRLTIDEMHREMETVASSGIQNILLLTGESDEMAPAAYIKEAVIVAKEYFPSISIEVQPLEVDEYQDLFLAGVDGVTVYQETYNRERYRFFHPKGKKSHYDDRYETPERIAKAGIRTISMGVLLGLADVAEDVHQLFLHLQWMEKHWPGVEYSLSFPRLIPLEFSRIKYVEITDITLIKLICLTRVLFPRVGINLSTRESATFRDHALKLGVTRISAASKTTVGGYTSEEARGPQFDIMDHRSVREVVAVLDRKGFDPVFTDWRRIQNEAAGCRTLYAEKRFPAL
ncbi:MAG: 2-iminoacetate synthase ThiH [bacterium]|nr:2-iminoacetate synthase ThiH [bacterium]